MNISIAGSGKISAGTYESIRISGSGRLDGLVCCDSFSTTGTSKGMEIECKNAFKISGTSTFIHRVNAQSVSVAGSFHCSGTMQVRDRLSCSGIIKCTGKIQCAQLSVSGELDAYSDIEAEKAEISGELNCEGLLNAETITIKGAGSTIGSIGGSTIFIGRGSLYKKMATVPLISQVLKHMSGHVLVKNGIEGDEITLEHVHTPRVSGRIVTIGDECQIDLVQYSQEVHISPNAKVGKTEKI